MTTSVLCLFGAVSKHMVASRVLHLKMTWPLPSILSPGLLRPRLVGFWFHCVICEFKADKREPGGEPLWNLLGSEDLLHLVRGRPFPSTPPEGPRRRLRGTRPPGGRVGDGTPLIKYHSLGFTCKQNLITVVAPELLHFAASLQKTKDEACNH